MKTWTEASFVEVDFSETENGQKDTLEFDDSWVTIGEHKYPAGSRS